VPTYQYACTACGHRFEAVQSFSDSSLTDCPECAGRLRKVFSSVGIVFKGSGFYRTDSRSGGAGKDGKDATDKVSADSSASSGSSDSKSSADSTGTSDSSAKKSDVKPASSSTSSTPAAASA
jgi:putative FmdB family regulatory protein